MTHLPRPRPQDLVREFHEAFGRPVADTPTPLDAETRESRARLIEEEAREAADALRGGEPLWRVASECADLLVVAYGTAVEAGIDLDGVVAEVHRSNMSKLGVDGRPIIDEHGKVRKGPNFVPPDDGVRAEVEAQAALAAARGGDTPGPADAWRQHFVAARSVARSGPGTVRVLVGSAAGGAATVDLPASQVVHSGWETLVPVDTDASAAGSGPAEVTLPDGTAMSVPSGDMRLVPRLVPGPPPGTPHDGDRLAADAAEAEDETGGDGEAGVPTLFG